MKAYEDLIARILRLSTDPFPADEATVREMVASHRRDLAEEIRRGPLTPTGIAEYDDGREDGREGAAFDVEDGWC